MRDTLNGQIKSIQFKTTKLNNPKNEQNGIELDLNYHYTYSDGTTYNFNFDKNGNNTFEQDWDCSYEKKFNDKNQVIERLVYTLGNETNKKLISKIIYSYEKNKVINMKTFSYFTGSECLVQEFIYEFDINRNMTAIVTNTFECGVQKHSTREERKYNLLNKIIEKKSFSRINGRSTVIEYVYDTKNNLQKEIQRNGSNDKIEKQTLFEYDKIKNTNSVSEFDSNKDIVKKEVIKFDKNKKLIEKMIYLKNDLFTTINYVYRENKLLEETHYKKNTLLYKKMFSYDPKGNITECTYYDDKNIAKRMYEVKIEYFK
ncbi:MAG TPA: hypothetical protein VIV55_02095 [Flavobacterium sp.]